MVSAGWLSTLKPQPGLQLPRPACPAFTSACTAPPPPAGPVAPDVAGQVVTHMPPHEQWRRFVYCTGMTGEVLGMVDHFK